MRVRFARGIAPFALIALLASSAAAKGGKEAVKPPEWGEENGQPIVHVFDPAPLKAYLHVPSDLPEGKKIEMIVVLHGHGGTATGLLGYDTQISDERKALLMACEGSGIEKTPQGEGHSWNGDRDATAILACLDAALAKYPAVDPKRVVIQGHSAGGTMSLLTYSKRPAAFAGIYTTASPMEPSSAHKGARIVVNVGTKDANYAGFPAARQAAEKTVVGRCVAVYDLAHDLPDDLYSKEAIAWLFDSKAPSETLFVPLKPDAPATVPPDSPAAKGKGGGFRHVLLFEAGGRGAPADAPAKPAAKQAAQALKAELDKAGAAGLDAAIAAKSQDALSKDAGGKVTGAVLARYGGALVAGMSKAKAGEWVGPFESDAGWHLVYRDP